MAWLSSIVWAITDTPVLATVVNNIGKDIRTWGGNVDAGGNDLTNTGSVLLNAGKKIGIGTTTPGEDLAIAGSGNHQVSIVGSTGNKAFFGQFGDNFGLAVNRRISDGLFTDATKAHGEVVITTATTGSTVSFSTTTTPGVPATTRFMVRANGLINVANAPTYASDAAAGTGGLVAGDIYKDSTGNLHIKL